MISLDTDMALEPFIRLDRDLQKAALTLSSHEARFLVDAYYAIQGYRIRFGNQIRALAEDGEPHELIRWMHGNTEGLEKNVQKALDAYSKSHIVGEWARCAPPGSRVLVESGRWSTGRTMPIEELHSGDPVVPFNRHHARMGLPCPVSVGVRPYAGNLIQVATADAMTEVTPQHKWLVRLDAPEEAHVVYLMRKGNRFRVGRTLAITKGNQREGRFNLRSRARSEQADQAWILKYFPTRREAGVYEAYIAAQYGLPMVVFEQTNVTSTLWGHDEIEQLFSMLDEREQLIRGFSCLANHGLSPDIPVLTDIGFGTKGTVAGIICHANNLVPEMMSIPVPLRGGGIEWQPITSVIRRPYDGPVYSLDVPKDHKYVQDGLVTCNSIPGIGPVIASGLLAHIDITKAPTAGHIWSYAGVVPGQAWEKGQKRPWNASLKRLLFLLGESFIKVQNRPNDIYGKIYAERKRLEQEANDYLFYADQAASILQSKRIGKDTDAYKAYVQGKLPPAHIHARARRYASKLFLAHLQHVMYEVEYKQEPPRPYVMEHLGHVDIIRPPRWPIEGNQEAVHADEIIQATPENWPEHAERTFPPRTPLYMTLEAQILQFKEAWQQLEQRALERPIGEPEDILLGFVPSATAPNLSERLARYRATRKP